jgi:hypothetical protein
VRTTAPFPESLRELMESMQDLIRSPRSLSTDEALRPRLEQMFAGSPGLLPAEQIEVYREQYWLRHSASLGEDFPGVVFLLGKERWQKVSRRYLSRTDSSAFALRDLGASLPAHIEGEIAEGTLAEPLGSMAREMAQLEWAYVDVFDAPDEPELDATRVASIAPDQWPLATFAVSGALRLLEFDYSTPDFRRAVKREEASSGDLPERFGERSYWVVYRRERGLWDKQVSEPAYRLLEELSRGAPLVPACEQVVARLPEAQARLEDELMTWFTLWGKLGWIRDVTAGAAQA